MISTSMPWMLVVQANEAVTPTADSAAATVVSAGVGTEAILLGLVGLAVVGGLVAMFAGDAVRRTERSRRAAGGDTDFY